MPAGRSVARRQTESSINDSPVGPSSLTVPDTATHMPHCLRHSMPGLRSRRRRRLALGIARRWCKRHRRRRLASRKPDHSH
jgi:hypothetical protein